MNKFLRGIFVCALLVATLASTGQIAQAAKSRFITVNSVTDSSGIENETGPSLQLKDAQINGIFVSPVDNRFIMSARLDLSGLPLNSAVRDVFNFAVYKNDVLQSYMTLPKPAGGGNKKAKKITFTFQAFMDPGEQSAVLDAFIIDSSGAALAMFRLPEVFSRNEVGFFDPVLDTVSLPPVDGITLSPENEQLAKIIERRIFRNPKLFFSSSKRPGVFIDPRSGTINIQTRNSQKIVRDRKSVV